MKHFYFFVAVFVIFNFGFGQTPIATIDRENGAGPTATDHIASMSAVGLTRGAGVNQAGVDGAGAFISKNYTISGDLAGAQATGDYIEWSLTANTTFDIALDAIDIRLYRNATGPENWQLFYSTDGFLTETAVSTPQTLPSEVNTITNFPSLGLNSGPSGTLTFRIYAWGATANRGNFRVIRRNSWSISPAVPSPGIRHTGTVTTSSTNDITSDIIASDFAPSPVQQNIDYSAKTTDLPLNFSNAVNLGAFTIRDAPVSASTDGDGTTLSSIEFAVANSENISALALLEVPTLAVVSEVTTVTDFTSFNGLNLMADEDSTKQFLVLAQFKTTVTDNDQIQLTINKVTTPSTGSSLFASANAGGAETPITGDDNRIEVTASQFIFDTQPTDTNMLEVMAPYPTLLAVDTNLNRDLDANYTAVGLTTIPGSSIVTETYAMTNGLATLNAIVFTSTEAGTSLLATEAAISGTSSAFDVNGPILNIIEQNFDTATGWNYTPTPAAFGTESDWATPSLGYFGEIDLTAASPLDNSLFSGQVFGENDSSDPTNPWGTLTFNSIDISAYTTVRIEFDWQVAGYTNNSNDIQYRIATNGDAFSGPWTTVFDGNGAINDAQGRVKIPVTDDNTSVALELRVRNYRSAGYAGFDNFRLVSEFTGLIYTAANGWLNNLAPNATTGASDAIVIDGSYDVSADVLIDNLIINSGATTVIGSGESITTNSNLLNEGVLELNSISTNYASLIVNGTVTNDVVYKRYVNSNANGNDLISAPVAGQLWSDFLSTGDNAADLLDNGQTSPTTYAFAPFDKTANAYVNYTDAESPTLTLDSGTGYRAATDAGTTLTFTGSVQTGQVTVNIVDTPGNFSDWNLIGNPYPSYLNMELFLNGDVGGGETNLSILQDLSGIYGYDGDASNGWDIVTLANAPGRLMTPGQGFLVAANDAFVAAHDITFDAAMRTTGTGDDFILGRTTNPLTFLKLNVSTTQKAYTTEFYFNANASQGLDAGYDGKILGSAPDFTLYSHLVQDNTGVALALQALNPSDLNTVVIPLGVNANQGEQLTFTISDSSLPGTVTVYLDDTVSNTSTLLNSGDYTLTPNVALNGTGRFYLRLSNSTLSNTELDFDAIKIYTKTEPRAIYVQGVLNADTTAKIYDLNGRLMYSGDLDRSSLLNQIDASEFSDGVYILTLDNGVQEKSQKLMLR
jgi:hypothetical protein